MIRRAKTADHGHSGRLRAYAGDARGAAVVEFALVMPVLILILLAGYEITQALSIDRKLVDTTAELAGIISQKTQLTNTAAQGYMTDTSQIMAPYSTAPLSITMLEVTTNSSCTSSSCPTTINWEQTQTGGVAGSSNTLNSGNNSWTLPSTLRIPSTSYILIQTTYSYKPTVGSHYVGTIPLSSQLYISPRQISTIPCSSCTTF